MMRTTCCTLDQEEGEGLLPRPPLFIVEEDQDSEEHHQGEGHPQEEAQEEVGLL